MQSWTVIDNDAAHEVVFDGQTRTGRAQLRIDDMPVEVPPVFLKNTGFFFPYFVGGTEILLRMDRKGDESVRFAVAGVYQDTGLPVESDVLLTLRRPDTVGHPLVRKNRSGMGTFLTYVGLTYLNIVLYVVNAPLTFPFSALVPQIILDVFYITYEGNRETMYYVIGIVLALVMTTVYLLLYALSRRYAPPLWIALLLVLADTAVVACLLMGDPVYYLLDALFHLAVLWALFHLIRTRSRMKRERLSVDQIT